MRKKRHLLAVTGYLVATAVVLGGVTAQADEPPRVPVAHLADTWADRVAREGTDTGPADPSSTFTAQVFLAGDARGLADYARAVSDPADPLYGHYLTPEQTRARFGPTPQRIDAVTAWLRGAGLSIDDAGPRAVVVHGTLAQATTAFGTRFDNYTFLGSPYRAAVDPVTVPAAVAPDVLTITGLTVSTTTGKPTIPTTDAARKAAGTPANPCPAYFGAAPATDLPPAYGHVTQWAPCGYTPQQVRDAYGITGTGLTGKGVTIGILALDHEVNVLSDSNRIATEHGEPAFAPGQFTTYLPSDAPQSQAGGEFTMDVQAAHAMAPDANIAYVVGSRARLGDRLLDAIAQVVDRHLADVVSGSVITGYTPGAAPDAIAAYERLFQEAAVEGITFTFASGDSGGGVIDGVRTVEYPPSSPWVTGVGGTTLALGRGNEYLWEIGWASYTTPLSEDGTRWVAEPPGYQSKASGGGTSTVFPQPSYQRGVVAPRFAGSPPMRTVPDVSALADYEMGLLVGETEYDLQGNLAYAVSNGGGTSLSSPLFAGIAALLVQERGPLGFANPALYARHGDGRFHEILGNPAGTTETVSFAVVDHGEVDLVTPGQMDKSDLEFGPGYNTTTGLGSPTRKLIDSFRPGR
ncbi:S53 family peptidase [Amycolatopsis sacchari]|uniref:S53 family peptidase n=1 Tax=Amycolatopsis sacchari TaxID=115433 RepID=UPI003D75A06D